MKNNTFVCAIAALSMSVSGLAFAQSDKDVRAERAGQGHTGLSLPRGDDHRGNRGRDDRRGPPPRMADGRGAGPDHNFYRGGRLPSEYRSRQYVVDDWRGHHLSAPPRGYHWVQTGGDYVLAAIATGVIASILLNQ